MRITINKLLKTKDLVGVSSRTYSNLIEEKLVNLRHLRLQTRRTNVFFATAEVYTQKDLDVHCNGKLLSKIDFQVDHTILSFESPPCVEDTDEFIINIKNIADTANSKLSYHSHGIIRLTIVCEK
ncbi:unnamed protein product [Rotaria magnacalcarata]|uniref:Uncharacterized protein n=1 Tax=Rotaria magnacalcarata TaxID=392030 RepID=A0A816LU24_9BILA|nr:unnamed protein product [Rotaria magnacalcarata]